MNRRPLPSSHSELQFSCTVLLGMNGFRNRPMDNAVVTSVDLIVRSPTRAYHVYNPFSRDDETLNRQSELSIVL